MYTFKPHIFTEHSPNSITRPEERMSSIIHCDGKNVYIYSGEDKDNLIMTDMWKYSLARQEWTLMMNENTLPDDFDDFVFGAIFESNYLIICTIREFLNDELLSRLHIYDFNKETVHVKETIGQIPDSLYGVNLIHYGKYLYTVGVSRGIESFSDVYKLNTENFIWEVVYTSQKLDANEPVPNSGQTLVFDNNMIYIFGGVTVEEFSSVTIPAFDIEKRCWKTIYTHGDENHIPHYPTEREAFGVTSYTDPDSGEINVILSGGQDDSYNRFNDIWKLNLTSSKWTYLKRFGAVLPHCLDNNSMAVSPAGQLFTFGGFIFTDDMKEGNCTSTLHSTWLRIPKLTDICWEAVFYYYPNLTSMTDEQINSLGLPVQLLKSRIN